MTELTVVLKDDHRTYRQKFLIYENYTMSDDDDVIRMCITEAKMNFDGDPESIQIKVHMEIQ